jgi:hemin uptake protein HemP
MPPSLPPPPATRAAQSSNGALPANALPLAKNVLQASDLLGSHHAVEIEHNGQRYRLQTTKAGKLILTK